MNISNIEHILNIMKKNIFSIFLALLLIPVQIVLSQSNCANAVQLDLNVYGTCGDMFFTNVNLNGAVTSSDAPAPTCGNFNAGTRDMWYRFTVPAGVTGLAFHAFNAVPPVPAIPPFIPGSPACGPGMAVYRGSCGALTLLNCFHASDGFMQNGEIRWELINGLVPGETIYVRLWEEDNDVTSFFFAASVITSLPESDCNNPPQLQTSGCNILAPAGTIQAPDDCGWSSTDNVVFYSFQVQPGDPQPVVIQVEYGTCWTNDVSGFIPSQPEIQFAVYSWNGVNCTGIGGSPNSDPPNNTTYHGCVNGTGTVTYSQNLAPGWYVLAMDGFSDIPGTSLCIFGIQGSFLDPDPDPDGPLSVSLNTVNQACGQMGSASITINSSCSGNPTVSWSTGATGLSINNLTAGNYSVTVSDIAPCVDTIINFNISNLSNFAISITTSGDPCTLPITAAVQVMGADPNVVNYSWSHGANGRVVSLNMPGTYTVTATYGTCTATSSINVQSANFNINVVYNPAVCIGTTGSAMVQVLQGSGNYMYEWSTGSIAPGIVTLPGHNYCVTVIDATYGCSRSRCFTVGSYEAIAVSIDKEDISCKGRVDGQAVAVVTGGQEPYTYAWSTFMSSQGIYNLISGNYSVTVTDANGCTGTASVFIEEPPQFNYTVTPNQGICFGQQATISINAMGGVQPYTYFWSDVPGLNVSSRIVSPTQTTTYTITVLDANGCTATPKQTTVFVSQPIVIDLSKQDVLCHGLCTGSASLNISGGIPPFVYSWESTNNNISNLCAGNYSVTVTDLYSCTGSVNFTITQPDTIYLFTEYRAPTCFGYTNGYVEVDVLGGVPFFNGTNFYYHYQWSNGGTVDSLAVGAGLHTVTVTDANGCSHTASILVDQPEAVYVTNPWGGTICIGQTFQTFVNATGGLGPYDFIWQGSDGSITYGPILTVSPTSTTIYSLTTTDSRGCYGPVKQITLKVNPPISIVATTRFPDQVCIGESVNVEMEILGGNGGPYTIFMHEYGVVNMPYTFTPSTSGYYYFTVSDDCGSPTATDSIYVTVHPLPHAAFYADKTASCPPGTFQFTEVTPDQGQTYLWDFGNGGFSVQKNPVYTYTRTGTYNVSLTVWSQYGCKRTITYNNMINIYPVPRADFAAVPEVVSVFDGQVEFNNYTEGATTFFWDFGDGKTTLWTNNKQIHTYTAVGDYYVVLIAKNQYECYDTVTKRVKVHDEFTFYAPTAFTPNNDGINDVFYVIGNGISKNDFYFCVYDRFGNKVFETTTYDPENPYRMAWDGSYNGSVIKGDPVLTNGIYKWYCKFTDFLGRPHEESGKVNLIR